ncbi:hypothetical protein F66182_3623 [Fusarium sp. NRRL 66182]|nr:hypothetical protein F66182_3623 [Fusarium sp. NRRL 66182]
MDSNASPNLRSVPKSSDKDETEEPVFNILKRVAEDVWIVTRQGDPGEEQYLASPSKPFRLQPDDTLNSALKIREASALDRLLSHYNQAYTVRQILNHENLLSIVGVIERQLFDRSQRPNDAWLDSEHLLVWDFGDAGNLSALFRQYPCESSSFYLPESLCWHVLRSLIRAVTYLHDGKRLYYPASVPDAPNLREWQSVDTDWYPILHRGIEPKNIWFQHARGTETYGQCKLGNFSNIAVTCHSFDRGSHLASAPKGIALATREGIGPLSDVRKAFEQDQEHIPVEKRPYTLWDEMWSVGATIFTMMTGQAPSYCCDECGCSHVVFCGVKGCLENAAAANGCNCLLGGCSHLTENPCDEEFSRWPKCPAEHDCSEPNINIHSYLARARYTKMLRTIVKDLLLQDPQEKRNPWGRMVDFAKVVEDAYLEWKKKTEEGKEYVDIEDDMCKRLENFRRKERMREFISSSKS